MRRQQLKTAQSYYANQHSCKGSVASEKGPSREFAAAAAASASAGVTAVAELTERDVYEASSYFERLQTRYGRGRRGSTIIAKSWMDVLPIEVFRCAA
jgi:hypothetical protein